MYDGISFGCYLWQYVYGGCDVFVPKQSQKLTARLFLHGSTIGDQINDLPHSYVATMIANAKATIREQYPDEG